MKTGRWLLAIIATLTILAGAGRAAPKVDPELSARLLSARPDALLGVVLTFHGNRVTDAQVRAVEALGINVGVRMRNFPIMGVNATPAQVKQMLGWNELRSVYLNSPLQLYLHQTKPLIGIDRLRKDADLIRRNGGVPVSGRNVTIAINDSGVDGTHADLKFDTLNPGAGQTIQNVLMNPNDKDGLVVRSNTLGNPLKGILPMTYVENVVNSDTNGGHGTHVASIAAGTGVASGGLYQGVAPGAKILGIGSGGGLFVLGQVAAFDYLYSFHFRDNVRVVNNSWGNSAVELDPDHPVNVASKLLHDEASVVVVFANGNDGPRPNTQNRWASFPWLISVAAGQKDGRLAGFSSRGILGDATVHPTITAPGTGVGEDPFSTSDINTTGLTAAVVAARSRVNPAANGLYNDKQIPAAFLPNYTQISGTSMAAPHVAGVVANILEADPSLLPDETRGIIERTATPLAAYDEFEVGAGMANVHAAVDLAFNPSKPYGNFGFTGKGLGLTRADGASLQGSVAPGGSGSHTFDVPQNARFTVVQLDWKGVGEGEAVVDNTQVVLHDLALSVSNGQTSASSDGINAGGLFAARESIKLEFPAAGTYTATVSAGILQFSTATDQPYRLSVTHFLYDPNEVTDIAALDAASREKVYRLVYDRIMFTEGGAFRPDAELTRMELARALMFSARVPQFIPNRPSFTDLAQGTPESLVAESLRREGVMGVSGGAFTAGASVSRLEQAVAIVRALRLDAQAKALANSNVTSGGQVLTDNAQIPGPVRGYVQIALDRGLMEAFPAEVRQVAPGQFQAFPGPRFEPNRMVRRAEFLNPASRLINVMFGE
ncbi:MAG TPA: S8 family serine peptidase [Pyrinomonadaceae bacterium]|nr:S8 family serine peptidase [Pyrinomonadaceae bacterium]